MLDTYDARTLWWDLDTKKWKSLLTVGRDVGVLDGLPVDGLIVGV
jgi:hypothetical protein